VPPPPAEPVEKRTYRSHPPGPDSAGAPFAPSSVELLRERFDRVGQEARKKRLRVALERAERAMKDGDYEQAALAFEAARKLDPKDGSLAARAEEARRLERERSTSG
jgi:thioredoxin-like negative regulator of GroEL